VKTDIGLVDVAAGIVNPVPHATGMPGRDPPITLDELP